MAKYGMSNLNAGSQQVLTSTYKTQWSLTSLTGATTLRKAWIYDVTFGTDGTPADNSVTYKIDRQTSVGTGSAGAPAPMETTDAAALIVATLNHTIEPTITAATQLLEIATNQRATYRWVAAPGGELVVPAVTVTGLGGRAKSPAYTGTVVATCHFWE
jgi:hypothetical protein